MGKVINLIQGSFQKFNINLAGKTVLTEAATGNYICTPILAALAGAKVFALAKDSKYGTTEQIESEIHFAAKQLNIDSEIKIIRDFDDIKLDEVDVLTNTGFVRPIDRRLIDKLKPDCVIPLMWEPWEFRHGELDLDRAISRGIKVYGTNEADSRLQTMKYIGITVLYFLLKEKRSCFSSEVLVIGCEKFIEAITSVLKRNHYSVIPCLTDEYEDGDSANFDAIVIAEYLNPKLIIGTAPESLIDKSTLTEDQLIIHIAGNVDFDSVKCKHYPDIPSPLGYMSYTTDFIDPLAVIDLHAAGLKVAEGLIKAKAEGLTGLACKNFMELNYPALAFDNEKYW
jgi:hypothetical protein